MAFTVGFVALLLARSELFTERFLVPVTAVVARAGTVTRLLRLWVVSLAANLIGGLVMAAMIVTALPSVRATAVETGAHYAELGVTAQSFFLAVLAGLVITVLTRMQHASDSLGLQVVPAALMSFVLVRPSSSISCSTRSSCSPGSSPEQPTTAGSTGQPRWPGRRWATSWAASSCSPRPPATRPTPR